MEYKKALQRIKMKQHNLKSFNGFETKCSAWGIYFLFTSTKLNRERNVVLAYNGLRLCVCSPLHNASILTINFMGQIAQNRCYKLARLI